MRTQQGIHVPVGEKRAKPEVKIWHNNAVQFKVAREDTDE